MTQLERTIKASLAYIGRNVSWLAAQLGMSEKTCRRRLNDDLWTKPDIVRMIQIFKWKPEEVLALLGMKVRER